MADAQLCEFTSDGAQLDECAWCNQHMPKGAPVYFVSDGGWEPRDGDYICKTCALSPTPAEEQRG